MKIESHEKLTILLAALSERYTALHCIRGRVENTGVWVIGLALAAGGWLLQSNATISGIGRAELIVATILTLAILRFMSSMLTGRRGLGKIPLRDRMSRVAGLTRKPPSVSTNSTR